MVLAFVESSDDEAQETFGQRNIDVGDSWNPQGGCHSPLAHSYLVLVPVSTELATVVRRFSQTGIQDFLTLTLREHSGLLYVGAREALFAFSVEALELQGVVRGGAVGGTQDWGVWPGQAVPQPRGLSLYQD